MSSSEDEVVTDTAQIERGIVSRRIRSLNQIILNPDRIVLPETTLPCNLNLETPQTNRFNVRNMISRFESAQIINQTLPLPRLPPPTTPPRSPQALPQLVIHDNPLDNTPNMENLAELRLPSQLMSPPQSSQALLQSTIDDNLLNTSNMDNPLTYNMTSVLANEIVYNPEDTCKFFDFENENDTSVWSFKSETSLSEPLEFDTDEIMNNADYSSFPVISPLKPLKDDDEILYIDDDDCDEYSEIRESLLDERFKKLVAPIKKKKTVLQFKSNKNKNRLSRLENFQKFEQRFKKDENMVLGQLSKIDNEDIKWPAPIAVPALEVTVTPDGNRKVRRTCRKPMPNDDYNRLSFMAKYGLKPDPEEIVSLKFQPRLTPVIIIEHQKPLSNDVETSKHFKNAPLQSEKLKTTETLTFISSESDTSIQLIVTDAKNENSIDNEYTMLNKEYKMPDNKYKSLDNEYKMPNTHEHCDTLIEYGSNTQKDCETSIEYGSNTQRDCDTSIEYGFNTQKDCETSIEYGSNTQRDCDTYEYEADYETSIECEALIQETTTYTQKKGESTIDDEVPTPSLANETQKVPKLVDYETSLDFSINNSFQQSETDSVLKTVVASKLLDESDSDSNGEVQVSDDDVFYPKMSTDRQKLNPVSKSKYLMTDEEFLSQFDDEKIKAQVQQNLKELYEILKEPHQEYSDQGLNNEEALQEFLADIEAIYDRDPGLDNPEEHSPFTSFNSSIDEKMLEYVKLNERNNFEHLENIIKSCMKPKKTKANADLIFPNAQAISENISEIISEIISENYDLEKYEENVSKMGTSEEEIAELKRQRNEWLNKSC